MGESTLSISRVMSGSPVQGQAKLARDARDGASEALTRTRWSVIPDSLTSELPSNNDNGSIQSAEPNPRHSTSLTSRQMHQTDHRPPSCVSVSLPRPCRRAVMRPPLSCTSVCIRVNFRSLSLVPMHAPVLRCADHQADRCIGQASTRRPHHHDPCRCSTHCMYVCMYLTRPHSDGHGHEPPSLPVGPQRLTWPANGQQAHAGTIRLPQPMRTALRVWR